jgi:hypothetical protein
MQKNPLIFFVYPIPTGSEENQFTAEYSAWGN